MKLQKLVEKLSRRALKNTCKNLLKNLAKTPKFIGCKKLAVMLQKLARMAYQSTGQSTDQRSNF